MRRKVLLISTNRCKTPDAIFPIGLSHLNAALRRAGHETRWFDRNADEQSLSAVLTDFRPHFVGVSIRNIDDVLIRKRQTYYGQLSEVCDTIRENHPCPVVLGGSGFSIFPRQLLELTGADFGIQGEGESSFLALITAVAQSADVSHVPGLVYRRGDSIMVNPQQCAIVAEPLEGLDRPAHLVGYYLMQSGMMNVQTQRGCAHTCCYCTYPLIEGRANRRRPPEVVAEEMAQLEAGGARYAFIVDSVFNSSPRHVIETCEALIRRQLRLRWGCFLRPQGLTRELVELMARAGLSHIEFGADSFCDAVLAACDKHLTFEDIQHSSELARQQQIDQCHFLICGGPGETLETLEASFKNSQRLNNPVIMACVGMRIYPGTALFQRALNEGRITADADMLTPVYYLAPGLTGEQVFAQIERFAKLSSNWIVGDPTPGYTRLVERLRARGVAGPLWSYFSMVQRLWPPTPAAVNA
jgi:radical SAM superfamily enzyme YgiQ (UPF0313 family)